MTPCLSQYLPLLAWLFVVATMTNSCSDVTERRADFEVHGIDVSHYQKEIQWDTVAAQGIHFGFIKASEGREYKDSIFQHNWADIKRAGILRGAYHFYIPSVPPEEQADNFIQAVKLEEGDLPPVLDFEKVGDKKAYELTADLKIWLTWVEREYGCRPIIYTNQKLYNRFIKGNFDGYVIWMARYNTIAPDMPIEQRWSFWQYSNRGSLEGVNGHVDLNVFNGSLSDLETLRHFPYGMKGEDACTVMGNGRGEAMN